MCSVVAEASAAALRAMADETTRLPQTTAGLPREYDACRRTPLRLTRLRLTRRGILMRRTCNFQRSTPKRIRGRPLNGQRPTRNVQRAGRAPYNSEGVRRAYFAKATKAKHPPWLQG